MINENKIFCDIIKSIGKDTFAESYLFDYYFRSCLNWTSKKLFDINSLKVNKT